MASLRYGRQARRALLEEVSRELSQPLTALTDILKLALKMTVGVPAAHSLLEEGLEQCSRVSQMNAWLSELAWADQPPVSPETIALGTAVNAAVEEVRALAESRGIKLSFLPVESPFVRADRRRLHRALQSVLSGAIRRSVAPGEISVQLWHVRRKVILGVRFRGISALEAEPLICVQPFASGREAENDSLANRVALLVARRTVEAFSGRLDGTRRYDGSCVFRMRLPCVVESSENAGPQTAVLTSRSGRVAESRSPNT